MEGVPLGTKYALKSWRRSGNIICWTWRNRSPGQAVGKGMIGKGMITEDPSGYILFCPERGDLELMNMEWGKSVRLV